jgi:hypothetical protein
VVKKKKGKDKDKDKDKSKDKSGKQGRKYCTHCKIPSHDKAECRKFKWEQEEKVKSAPQSAKIATVPDANATDATVNLATTSSINVTHLYLTRTELSPIPAKSQERALKTQNELKQSGVSNRWIMDSGASRTMCLYWDWFTYFTPLEKPISVMLGDDSQIPAPGIGCVLVHMLANGMWTHTVFQNMLYIPNLHRNLLSVPHLADCGAEVCFKGENCSVYDKDELTCEG